MTPSRSSHALPGHFHRVFVRKMLWLPGLFLIGAAVLLSIAWPLATSWLAETRQAVQAQERQLAQTLSSVRFLQEQRRLFERYGPAYQSLLQQGLVHRQDRVRWTDRLLQQQAQKHLSPFVIQYEPRQPLSESMAGPLPWKEQVFSVTRLHLEAGVHTESDLKSVMDQVARELTPLFLTERCDISQRVAPVLTPERPVAYQPNRPGLIAQCTLLLFEADVPPLKPEQMP
ncbi:hypothetical protein [Thiomicrospira sp. WB1]|uniref:hypothetical protein n=1 Tax=Thiomicrospira sp. WB1 TaxID=1685380 RepID=UPI00074A5EB2|nr:hypothetical protein [Thiomicrospira sp. WB1]KUJ72738.1 hypothetical protein AVO41_02795 [Thiomicrospira sp. WB1]